MAVYPDTLPTNNTPNATPTRKEFSSYKVTAPNIQSTPQSQEGTLAFLRSKGVTNLNLAGQRKSRR